MKTPKSSLSTQTRDQKLSRQASQTQVSSEEKPPSAVIASPQEAPTTAPPSNFPQGARKTTPTSAIKTESKSEAIEKPELLFGFVDDGLWESIFTQIRRACSNGDGKYDGARYISMLAVMVGQQPRDHFELMLINQLSGLHDLVMKYIGILARAEIGPEIDLAERTLNKLARTFSTVLDQLHRYRSGGGQKVTVQQNVSVSEGGQAIVGNVTQSSRDNSKAEAATASAAITDTRPTPMPIVQQSAQPVTAIVRRRPRQ